MKSETASYHNKITQTCNKTRHSFAPSAGAGTQRVLCSHTGAQHLEHVGSFWSQKYGGRVAQKYWDLGAESRNTQCPTISERVAHNDVLKHE